MNEYQIKGSELQLLQSILGLSRQDTTGCDTSFYFQGLKFDPELAPRDQDEEDHGENEFDSLDQG